MRISLTLAVLEYGLLFVVVRLDWLRANGTPLSDVFHDIVGVNILL